MVDYYSAFSSGDECLNEYQLEKGIQVMIVDDDRDFLNSLQFALKYYGLSVTCCENATEALLRSIFEEFDYVVTDYNMPGMNGIELTQRLRGRFPGTVIIGMSGNRLGEEFLRRGANDFIEKPFNAGMLAMMIDGRNILS